MAVHHSAMQVWGINFDPTDWLNAGGSVVTGFIAWVLWREQNLRERPIRRLTAKGLPDERLEVSIYIRNRSDEPLFLTRVEAVWPRGTLITKRRTQPQPGHVGDYVDGGEAFIEYDREIEERGGRTPTDARPRDDCYLSFCAKIPRWSGSRLGVRVRLERRSGKARPTNLVLWTRIPSS